MPLDRAEMGAKIRDETVGLTIAEEHRDPPDPGAVRRERMGLCIIDHLQAMLEATQKPVIVDQLRSAPGVDAPGGREAAQGFAGGRDLQFADPAAPDQLLGLGEELDLPDPAPTGFYIVAFDGDSPTAAMRIDLALDRVDV